MSQSGRTPTKPDKTALAAELEETRRAFHRLVSGIPADAWEAPTANPAWNVRQLMLHITIALQNLPLDIKAIRKGWSLNIPGWLFDWFNVYYTRWLARGHTPASVSAKYDRDHEKIVDLLHSLPDEDLLLTGNYPQLNENMPGGEHSIADMFHYITLHFHEHAAEVQAAID